MDAVRERAARTVAEINDQSGDASEGEEIFAEMIVEQGGDVPVVDNGPYWTDTARYNDMYGRFFGNIGEKHVSVDSSLRTEQLHKAVVIRDMPDIA